MNSITYARACARTAPTVRSRRRYGAASERSERRGVWLQLQRQLLLC
eukprot:COSAG02_NODE_53613_length_300_cov_1.651741_1_plen_46_part_10